MDALTEENLATMERMANLISEGADTFLRTQYISITLFVILFSVLIVFVVEKKSLR